MIMTRRRGARGIVVQYDGETDYGGREFLMVFGKAPMTNVAPTGGGTALSESTIQITTGLSDVYSFGWSMESTTVTAAATYVRNLSINWQKGYIDNGGVTLTLYSAVTADKAPHPMIAMVPGSRDWSGCTLNWIAIGKERAT
jgi:hypothetical protein